MSNDSYDMPWKGVLDHFFEPAMAFFFPQIYEAVDWSHEIVFLDKELEQLLPDAEVGLKRVDKLAKVRLKSGKIRILYIHIEVQNQKKDGFPKRVFHYYFRLMEQFGDNVATGVILGDEHPNWRPDSYKKSLLGTELDFRWPMVKLWDYLDQWEALEANPNPFALVVMTHLKAKQTRNNPGKRFDEKLYLVKEMRRRGFSVKDSIKLLRFLGWVMAIPKDLEDRFWEEAKRADQEEETMWYIEQRLMEEGKKEGKKEGKIEGKIEGKMEGMRMALHNLILQKFGDVPSWVEEKMGAAEFEQLNDWLMRAALVNSLEEAFARHSPSVTHS